MMTPTERPPSAKFVVLTFLIVGPLLLAGALLVTSGLSSHSPVPADLVVSPILAVFGAFTSWKLAFLRAKLGEALQRRHMAQAFEPTTSPQNGRRPR